MNISIFGYKLNLEILILIGVIYLIMVGHLFCGCCNFKIMEGFDASGNNLINNIHSKKTQLKTQIAAGGPTTIESTSNTKTEAFTTANTNYGQSSPYDLTRDIPIDTSSWNAQNMTIQAGQSLSDGVKKFLAREPQPVPLPEGELFMFANTKFAPEFCPNTYSTSSGCAAMTGAQYNYLINRGGNNVPYSEY